MRGVPIREAAERSGVAAGTIRQWEQRFGFPVPARTAAGYRVYSEADVAALRRVVQLRRSGLSVAAAVERARRAEPSITEHPSIFGAVPHQGRAHRLRKRTLVALSRAIEDETLASAASPLVLGAFQRVDHYRAVEHRYRRLAQVAEATVVFADFGDASDPERDPVEVPIEVDAAIGHEWAVVVDAPGFSACLTAWEPPAPEVPADDLDRVFETFWTLESATVRRAAEAGAQIARPTAPAAAERIGALLAQRPVGGERSAAALEGLTARMVAYLEADTA